MFITAASAISPQKSFRNADGFTAVPLTEGNRLVCAEPDYSSLIEPKLIRRMSRIIRMGVATAIDALQQAGVTDPSAIITGTAYGCLEDTGIFLKRMVENKEEMLTPTAFIQSTHNTVGAQIALMLKCNAYNNTYVHRALSFETALLDTMMLLKENGTSQVLVGAADELTDQSFIILERFGLFRKQPAGEGAAFFVTKASPDAAIAEVKGIRTLINPGTQQVEDAVKTLLQTHGLGAGDVQLLLSGRTADTAMDQYYNVVEQTIGNEAAVIQFKALCGEYPTSTSFALWLACNTMQGKTMPGMTNASHVRYAVIYNADKSGYHSIMLISKC